jgi:hypothetical protein
MDPSTYIHHGIQFHFLFTETESIFLSFKFGEQNIVGLAFNAYLGKICGNSRHVDADWFLFGS